MAGQRAEFQPLFCRSVNPWRLLLQGSRRLSARVNLGFLPRLSPAALRAPAARACPAVSPQIPRETAQFSEEAAHRSCPHPHPAVPFFPLLLTWKSEAPTLQASAKFPSAPEAGALLPRPWLPEKPVSSFLTLRSSEGNSENSATGLTEP